MYLTVAVTLDEEHRSEQVDAIKRLLSDSVISDVTPKATLFDETVADDVSLEISDSYMQLQKGTDTVLVSAFQQSIDTSLLSKSLTLPNGLTLKYGDVKDSQTGYNPLYRNCGRARIQVPRYEFGYFPEHVHDIRNLSVTAAKISQRITCRNVRTA